MIVSKEKPKIYERLHKKFGIDWEQGICIVWGDTCHSKYDVRPDLFAHEEVHCNQQKSMGPEIWWETYITTPSFRLSQELEAYKAQIKYLREHVEEHSREVRRFAIDMMCKQLASPVYGNIVSYKKAKELLK